MERNMVRAQALGQDSHCHWGNESTGRLSLWLAHEDINTHWEKHEFQSDGRKKTDDWAKNKLHKMKQFHRMTSKSCIKPVRETNTHTHTMQLWIHSLDLVKKKKKKGKKKANILEECVKCAAWEEEFDTCGCLLDMRSCQGFQGAAPHSTFAVMAVNLICVLRCEGDCVYVCVHIL